MLMCADDWLLPGTLAAAAAAPHLARDVDLVTVPNHFARSDELIFRTIAGPASDINLGNLLAGRPLTNARIVKTDILKRHLPVRHRIPMPAGRITLASDLDLWLRARTDIYTQVTLTGGGIVNRWHQHSLTFNDNPVARYRLSLDVLWFIRDNWLHPAKWLTLREHILFAYYSAKRCTRVALMALQRWVG